MEGKKKVTLNDSINCLEFSSRINISLYRAGIEDIKTLVERNVSLKPPHKCPHLLSLRNLGKNSLEEIVNKVHALGFVFHDEDGYNEMMARHEKEFYEKLSSELNSDINTLYDEKILEELVKRQTEENNAILQRIARKKTLLSEYERLMRERLELMSKEQSLDSLLAKLIQEINDMRDVSDESKGK